jgi:hypothetical protein
MSKLKVLKKLGAIQSALKVAKGSKNSHGNYNYRSAEDILEALKPHATKQKVTFLVTEQLKEINGVLYIESTATMYDLESDEAVSSSAPAIIELQAKGMHMPQRTGSAGSYAKKYALGNLCAIDDTKDADATNKGESEPAKKAPAKPAARKAMSAAVYSNFMKGIKEGNFDLVKKKVKEYTNDESRKKVVKALMDAIENNK